MAYDDLPEEDQATVDQLAEDRYLAYVFVEQCNQEGFKEWCHMNQSGNIAKFPANPQAALKALKAYIRDKNKSSNSTSQGSTFDTHGKASSGSNQSNQSQSTSNKDKSKAVSFDPGHWAEKT